MTTDSNLALFEDDRSGAIYRTAAEMIHQRGFDATSMSQIAEAVRLTKPGLYYYVKGKKELLFAIMSFAMDVLEQEVVEPARAMSDPEERLRAIVRSHAELLTRERNALAILIDEVAGLSARPRARIIARKRRYFELLRETLEEIRRSGRLRPLDTTVAAFSLLGMVMWISRWYDQAGRLSGDEVARNVAEIALGAMLQPPTNAGPRPVSDRSDPTTELPARNRHGR